MKLTNEAGWFDFLVLIIVFAIIPIKLFLVMWYKARKDKKKNKYIIFI